MNRPKIWLYVALLLCAGAANLIGLSRWLTHRSIAQVDRELVRAVAQVDARSQLLALEAAHLADAVARDPAVLQALSGEGDAKAAAAAHAAAQAARGPAADAGRTQLVGTFGRGGRTFTVNGAPVQGDPQLDGFVSGAAADAARRDGYAVVGDALYYVVATPAGRGSAVGVGVPANAAWLSQLRASTGADVTLLLPQRPARGTLAPEESETIAKAVRAAAGPVDVGTLPSQPLFGPGTTLATVPLLFASAPAYRAHPVALRGLPGGQLALSQPMSPLLAPVVSYGWVVLAGLVILLLAGVATALSIPNEQEMVVPKDLLATADRITRRDFTARAPVMAGSLGTVAAALNCAAEAARSAGAAAHAEGQPAPAAAAEPAPAPEAGAPEDVFARFAASSDVAEAPPAPPPTAPAAEPVPAEAAAQDQTPSQEVPPEGPPAAELAEAAIPAAQQLGTGLDSFLPGGTAAEDAAAPGEAPRAREEVPEAAPFASPADSPEPAPANLADQLAAAAQEPEPAPSHDSPFAAATENGVLAGMPGSEAMVGSLGSAVNTASPSENTLEAAAADEARPAPLAEPAPEPVLPPAFELARAPAEDGDEEHWRVTYDEFVKVREQCGESHQGLPYERFRQKLQKNRDQLVAKYGCRTVRFQVYVKEGKAALKASPVR